MASALISKIGDNILSPIGLTTAENYQNILDGVSALTLHTGTFGLPEPFCASLLDREQISQLFRDEITADDSYTFFEKCCILSASRALSQSGLSPDGDDVLFILSTTKGNVDLLSRNPNDSCCYLSESALKISRHFGNNNQPLVVSNACISGVCAQIAAVRALLGDKYKYVVGIGADVLSRFVISGFQSFKALSADKCKPYDKNRCGLNLGEAAGTIILTNSDPPADSWHFVSCSNHNDANHISGPSRTGEGSFRVLRDILHKLSSDDVAFINTHGTATAYNDEMESIALHRAALDNVPVCAFKGCYGHTLGAAGIIETILSMQAIEHGNIPATAGYDEPGTSFPPKISNKIRLTDKRAFIKILSGFGGSNAGIAYRKEGEI